MRAGRRLKGQMLGEVGVSSIKGNDGEHIPHSEERSCHGLQFLSQRPRNPGTMPIPSGTPAVPKTGMAAD